ncbi:hypothetical protein FPV67DRAFT_1216579 [Lyophyllum atratum]|nr:hypothetical protein FPV67DRAFT_1216579 [Lyophyllum atratum]
MLYSVLIIALSLVPTIHAAVNFDTCLNEVRSGKWGLTGGTDNRGHPISNIENTTAIVYDLCIAACGSSSEPFEWYLFSQQFGAWLLPWLALISQLPYGTHNFFDNLFSMLLTVGSPTLAAYSMILTVLNGRWIARRFSAYRSKSTRNAVKALSSLQQSPLNVTTDLQLLASLVYLPENEKWWSELVEWLEYTHTWSISAGASIAWVSIAYVFTVVDSMQGDITISVAAHGQGIGSIWMWLLPVVTGWLQISPKCDSARLHQAVKHANTRAFVETASYEGSLVESSSEFAIISLANSKYDLLRCDESCTAPIFNYARFLSWAQGVEVVARMFQAVEDHDRDETEKQGEDEEYGQTTTGRIANCYSRLEESASRSSSRWGPGIWSRFIVASILALFLQWGTTGAAMLVNYFTPTFGVGCRTVSYLLYGSMSTLVWILLVLSSFLSHYATTTTHHVFPSAHLARRISIALRIIGKVIASCNAIWIILACLFQFANFYNRCYCNSSVIGLGSKAYSVLQITQDDIPFMRLCWTIGVAGAAGSAAIFMLFVTIFINPPLPNV